MDDAYFCWSPASSLNDTRETSGPEWTVGRSYVRFRVFTLSANSKPTKCPSLSETVMNTNGNVNGATAPVAPPVEKDDAADKAKDGTLPLAFRMRRAVHTLPFLSPLTLLVFVLLLLGLLHAAAILVFTRGFLLTRPSVPTTSDCDPGRASCSFPPTHSKLVFIVIDALRADFVLPVEQDVASPFHHNRLTLPAKLTSDRPEHSFLSHFIADPPTTTLQRLKGLTTGSLPTFVDAGSNFGGEAIDEDTWIAQAKRAGKRVKQVGDDTWLHVFPPSEDGVWALNDTDPFDSFNVEDLDTVDNGVRDGLSKLLSGSHQSEWDIVIAHMLGLDHAGHRFGATHVETTRKLLEAQALLEQVVDQIDNDTLLVVIGDHGMTDRGDHGGDSREEVDAALWVYSKSTPLMDQAIRQLNAPPIKTLINMSSEASHLGDRLVVDWPEKGLLLPWRCVAQVDFVPTISLLLGLPIPFGSLGLPIPELFFRSTYLPTPDLTLPTGTKRGFFGRSKPSNPEEHLTPLQTLLHAHLLSASQLEIYLGSPATADLRPAMPELAFTLSLAQSTYRGAHAPGVERTSRELQALTRFRTYIRRSRESARNVWARFDARLMVTGVLMWLGSIIAALKLISSARSGVNSRFVAGQGVEAGFLGLCLALAFLTFGPTSMFKGMRGLSMIASCTVGIAIGSAAAPGAPSRWSFRDVMGLWPLAIHAAIFASNSFTVFEDSIVLFVASSLAIQSFIRGLAAPEARLRKRIVGLSLTVLVCLRAMSISTICREEQIPRCHANFYSHPTSWQAWTVVGGSFVAAWFIPTALLYALKLSASNQGLAPAYLGGLVRVLLLGGSGYWAFDQMIAAVPAIAPLASQLKNWLARFVLVGSLGSCFVLWPAMPVPLKIQRESVMDLSSAGETKLQVSFIGFANSFGSTYLLFFSTIFCILFLVNPPPAQLVLALHLFVIICLLELFDSERDVEQLRASITADSLQSFLQDDLPAPQPHSGPTFTQISLLALVSQISFFATGHQAVLSTIQWSTAFIGFKTVVFPFSHALVILNTLGPFVLTALAVPLFVLWTVPPTLRDQRPPVLVVRHLIRAGASYSTYHAIVSLSSAVFAAYFRRHLMVWKIFAPRFMVGAITVLVTDVTLVLVGVAWGTLVTLNKVRNTFGTKFAE